MVVVVGDAQLTFLALVVLSWDNENSWGLRVVMGRWPEAGSFIWGLWPLLWAGPYARFPVPN